MKNRSFIIVLLPFLLFSCMADIRTTMIKKEGITAKNVEEGKRILEASWKKQGFDQIGQFETYSFTGNDIWKGMMGRMGKPWPEAKSTMQFRYEVGSFDSQVTYLDGKRQGVTAGLQSWNYYEAIEEQQPEKLRMNKRARFGLSAYHYFFEMLHRLREAPIISWAGREEFMGQSYDLIFVTWNKPEPHMENDQYKLLINRKTQMLDYAIYTLRENYLKVPGSRVFYGSIKFEDYRNVKGVMIPHIQTVFLNKPKQKDKKHLHRLVVKSFSFDTFDKSMLKPFADVQATGDSKEKG